MSYNPMDDALLSSSILAEGPDVVAAWALLIASADRFGESELTVPFVASVLHITNERAAEAFRVLSSPDPMSRNRAFEGRRIVERNERWFLVSHEKYRKRASRQAATDRQARYAAKKKKAETRDATCETAGCTRPVSGAVDGRVVCSAHAFPSIAKVRR